MTPIAFSGPAGLITCSIDDDVPGKNVRGFQPILGAFRSAWAAALTAAITNNVSAPDPFSVITCESTVGSVTSYEASATIMLAARLPRPSLRPDSPSFP